MKHHTLARAREECLTGRHGFEYPVLAFFAKIDGQPVEIRGEAYQRFRLVRVELIEHEVVSHIPGVAGDESGDEVGEVLFRAGLTARASTAPMATFMAAIRVCVP